MTQFDPVVPILLALFVAGLGVAGLYAKYRIRQIDRRLAENEAIEAAPTAASAPR